MNVLCKSQLFILILMLFLTGCATTRLLKYGDKAVAENNPVAAREYFERALSRKPKLSQDRLFMEKLRNVRYDASTTEADAFRSQNQWNKAIFKYEEALKYRPGDPAALADIERTRKTGCLSLYNAALEDAERDSLNDARFKISEALSLIPNDPLSVKAGKSLDTPEESLTAQGISLYREGVASENSRNWHPARDAYSRLIASAPWHLPAIAGKSRSQQKIRNADALADRAGDALSRKNIPETRRLLAELVSLYPQHGRHPVILAEVMKIESEVKKLLLQAETEYNAEKFDEAIRLSNEALKLYPQQSDAIRWRDGSEHAAVSLCLKQADTLSADNRYSQAAEYYNRVFNYRYGHQDARKGLARLSRNLHRETLTQGKPASALLWALDAENKMRGTIPPQSIEELKQQIVNRHPMNISLMVTSPGNVATEAAWLKEAILPGLVQTTPGAPSYTVTVDLIDIFSETRIIKEEDLNQPYDVPIEVSNPYWYQLRAKVRRLRDDYAEYESSFNRSQMRYIHFKQRTNPNDHKRLAALNRLRAERDNAEMQLRNIRLDLRRAEYRLNNTSHTITKYDRHYWNYQSRTVELMTAVKIRMQIRDSGGRIIDDYKYFDSKNAAGDTMIINPNPDVGVSPDPLELPSEISMKKSVIADISAKCTNYSGSMVLSDLLKSLEITAANTDNYELKLEQRLAGKILREWYTEERNRNDYSALLSEISYPR